MLDFHLKALYILKRFQNPDRFTHVLRERWRARAIHSLPTLNLKRTNNDRAFNVSLKRKQSETRDVNRIIASHRISVYHDMRSSKSNASIGETCTQGIVLLLFAIVTF